MVRVRRQSVPLPATKKPRFRQGFGEVFQFQHLPGTASPEFLATSLPPLASVLGHIKDGIEYLKIAQRHVAASFWQAVFNQGNYSAAISMPLVWHQAHWKPISVNTPKHKATNPGKNQGLPIVRLLGQAGSFSSSRQLKQIY
ncbi:MAG: hypothetical protein Q4B94_07230 [Pseudomonadota bacterium]|nr:hypothetical protein [Pseudomonadota bacterium]